MKIRIGTRKSRLALIQTEMFISSVKKTFPQIETEIINITTKGDVIIDRPLEKIGGKGVFTEAIENALLDKKIDFAVHSAKDMPSEFPEELCVSAVLERAEPNDVLVTRKNFIMSDNIKIGTSSRRRTAGMLKIYPNAEFADIRGNVDTRLNKLAAGEYDAVILAAAGLERLGAFSDERFDFEKLDTKIILPAPCQGIIAVQSRADEFAEILEAVNHAETFFCYQTERKTLTLLDSGCSSPVGALAFIKNNKINISITPDQQHFYHDSGDISERISVAERTVKKICAERFT